MTISKKCVAKLVVVATALTFSVENATGQGPGGNAGRGGAAAANASDRVQGQINQRAQAQVQQRVQAQTQAQIQTRVQGQVQGRIQAEAKRAAEVAQRAAESSARRASASTEAKTVAGGGGLQGNAAARGNVAAGTPNSRANAGLAIAADASRNNGFADADVAIYDNIFGRFNPIRQNDSAGEDISGSTADTANGAARRSSQAGERANPNASAGTNARGQGPQNVDIARGIQVAAQKRRAEIAQLRDQAIATGQTDLMLRADEMEMRLDAFVAAQQQLERGRPGQADSPRTANRLNGSIDGSTQIQN
ncbi:MAG TPA: hypothetical protein DDZ51_11665 [Planctomycetaceae bacterium]|nr:hypothetical protein [Planctomycetaceae bacterium]